MTVADAAPPIKAMVSYAWDTDEHNDKVQALVDRLLGDGIDMVFDQYDLRDGDDVNQFMEQVAADGHVKKVIAICTPKYVRKMNTRDGGSGQEGMIMSPHVYAQLRGTVSEAGSRERKFIAVIFERDPALPDNDPRHLPTMFGSIKYIDLSTPEKYDENYEQLLRFILDKPVKVRPAVGQIPAHLREDAAPPLPGHAQALTLRRLLDQGKANDGTWRDYLDQVEASLLSLKPAATLNPRTEVNFQVMLDEANRFTPVRDEFVSVILHAVRAGQNPMPELLPFFERLLSLQERLREQHRDGQMVLSEVCFAHVDFLVRELVLYMAAILIDEGQTLALRDFCDHTFFVSRHGQLRPKNFTVFSDISEQSALEQWYNAATNQNWKSAIGAWTLQRTTLQSVPHSSLIQADMMLMLKSALLRNPKEWGGYWMANLGPYTETSGAPAIFTYFQSLKRLQPWMEQFFAALNVTDLKDSLLRAFPEDRYSQAMRLNWSSYRIESHLNIEQWGQLP